MVTLLRKPGCVFLSNLTIYFILDGDEPVAVPKPFEDHSYSLPSTAPAVAAEPVDAAVQVGEVSCIKFNLHNKL